MFPFSFCGVMSLEMHVRISVSNHRSWLLLRHFFLSGNIYNQRIAMSSLNWAGLASPHHVLHLRSLANRTSCSCPVSAADSCCVGASSVLQLIGDTVAWVAQSAPGDQKDRDTKSTRYKIGCLDTSWTEEIAHTVNPRIVAGSRINAGSRIQAGGQGKLYW